MTSYAHDTATGYITVTTNPDSTTTSSSYDANVFHRLHTFTDENGNTTTYTNDSSNGHLNSVTDALGKITYYTYYTGTGMPYEGLVHTVTDPVGKVTTYVYDSDQRVTSSTTPYSSTVLNSVSLTYDSTTGEVASTTDALGNATSMTFDSMGRMLSQTTADGFTEYWVFNSSGMLDNHTDKMSVISFPNYDSYGRGLIVSQTQAKGTSLQR